MRKTASALAVIAVMTTGLVACNNADNNEGAMDTRNNNATRQVGYYTNDNNDVTRGYDRDGNEGPVTDMFDGDRDTNYRRVNNDRNARMDNPMVPLGSRDNNIARDVNYSRNDVNYHGHLNNRANNVNNGRNDVGTMYGNTGTNGTGNNNMNTAANNTGYYNRADQDLADKVVNRVEKMANVDDARVLVTDDNIVVAVDTNDRNNKNVEKQVAKSVDKMANGRNVRVVTDEAMYTRIRNVDNDIRNNVNRTDIGDTIGDIMRDLGNAIQRPFQNNR
ncbi:YhcN/YlaJ family sporulation lipoprotein [Metabacillus fastidiosus]|uniref:YhcN/YlaJ family sporulation lipoprotein n=1 Tax=Metabacillus fastidiosus TaxID=1458 RepID=UPI000824EF4E|nr:YhcN/YlaJ family sporulation lipoprotein [Metabacillus fastidiosus]MED4463993.1 YhcN/YlaJ family sporulation lipoprotein [Metabacillus fastidiosus]